MNECKNCQKYCFPYTKFNIQKLDGCIICVNSKLYCSKNCFVMKNILIKPDSFIIERSMFLSLLGKRNNLKKQKTN